MKPLGDAEWPTQIADMLGSFASRLNVYRTMANNPALMRAWSDLRNHVVMHNALGDQELEIVILRTGVRRQSNYEWLHHIVRGRAAGLSDRRIGDTRNRPPGLPVTDGDDDSLLIAAVDALVDDGKLSDDLVTALECRFGQLAVLDLMATIGMYTTLSFILETYAVPVDADIADALADRPFPADTSV